MSIIDINSIQLCTSIKKGGKNMKEDTKDDNAIQTVYANIPFDLKARIKMLTSTTNLSLFSRNHSSDFTM